LIACATNEKNSRKIAKKNNNKRTTNIKNQTKLKLKKPLTIIYVVELKNHKQTNTKCTSTEQREKKQKKIQRKK